MRPHYKQLTADDRLVIESLLADGLSLRAVAARIGVHASTVCRERQRGKLLGFDRYLSVIGQRTRQAGRASAGLARRKLGTDARSSYWPLVLPYLRLGWSQHRRLTGEQDLLSMSPSPETEPPRGRCCHRSNGVFKALTNGIVTRSSSSIKV